MIKQFEGYSVLVEMEGPDSDECCILITQNNDGGFDYEFFDVEVEYKASVGPYADVALGE